VVLYLNFFTYACLLDTHLVFIRFKQLSIGYTIYIKHIKFCVASKTTGTRGSGFISGRRKKATVEIMVFLSYYYYYYYFFFLKTLEINIYNGGYDGGPQAPRAEGGKNSG
jgi:hypothetical protein